MRRRTTLDEQYGEIVKLKKVEVSGHIIDPSIVTGKRTYLERRLSDQWYYEYGFYDSTAVLMRRLMESLLIEIYIHEKRTAEIRKDGAFLRWNVSSRTSGVTKK